MDSRFVDLENTGFSATLKVEIAPRVLRWTSDIAVMARYVTSKDA